jgi:hypothetical protein
VAKAKAASLKVGEKAEEDKRKLTINYYQSFYIFQYNHQHFLLVLLSFFF